MKSRPGGASEARTGRLEYDSRRWHSGMLEAIKAQKGKVAAAGAIFVLAFAVYWFRGREKPVLPNSINMVCVQTGKTYQVSRKKLRELPAPNPDTGTQTLVPFYVTEAGVRRMDPHFAALLKRLQAENKVVDEKTLEIRSP